MLEIQLPFFLWNRLVQAIPLEAGLKNKGTPYLRICDRIEAIHRAIDIADAGDVILLAGKGHEDYQIVGHEKHHMDEREIVADYLKKQKAEKKL